MSNVCDVGDKHTWKLCGNSAWIKRRLRTGLRRPNVQHYAAFQHAVFYS